MMREVEYVVSDEKEIVIVDQFTGRMMPGRAYSDGLHQAIEAKEGVPKKKLRLWQQSHTKTSSVYMKN